MKKRKKEGMNEQNERKKEVVCGMQCMVAKMLYF